MKNYVRLFLLIYSVCLFIPAYPISMSTANNLAVGAGVTVGIGTAVVTYKLLDRSEDANNPQKKNTIQIALRSFLAGAVAMLGSGFLARWGFYYLTPDYKLQVAREQLKKLNDHHIAKQAFEQQYEIFDAVKKHYVNNEMWMVVAFRDMGDKLQAARQAHELATKAQKETGDNPELQQQSTQLMGELLAMINNLSRAMITIRDDNRYENQRQEYEKTKSEQEKREMQKQDQQMRNRMTNAAIYNAYFKNNGTFKINTNV